jgi:uncharacterized lipoprotein YddW (UPF0748 family)
MMNIRKLINYFTFGVLFFLSSCGISNKIVKQEAGLQHPKREFRGAWIHTVGQSQYAKMSSSEMKLYFVDMLDKLQAAGINAVVFQVRPQADAFYKSDLEPWSRYLTGVQGKAPDEGFDPLAFMVEECHKRCIELHAWLNPYRVTNSESQTLAPSHIYHKHPERFLKYGTQLYFDPGIPENRDFICRVVKDIALRYNVDAIHMDDYFYPYPISGKQFPDDMSFQQYASMQGFSPNQRDDWRRNNVNMLIKEIKETLLKTKPWVRFGISPFGIYRNKKNTPDGSGSDTNGLQNYDDLYADVKLWVKNGWIDYNIPQLYWEIGNKAADYAKLIGWWADNNYRQHLYIGQDVGRMMDKPDLSGEPNQLKAKMSSSRAFSTIHGNCFWPGYLIMDNYKGVSDQLSNDYHRYPALIPPYLAMHNKRPKKVYKVEEHYTPEKHFLRWIVKSDNSDPTHAQYFVVYRFRDGEPVNINSAENIVKITRYSEIELPYEGNKNSYVYVVTAVDAFNNESAGKSKKIIL